MEFPKEITAHCPFCNRHTTQKLSVVKKRKASELKQGQRRFRKVMRGYRGFPRPKPEGREKPTRRINLLYTCTTCGKSHYRMAFRAKRFTFKGS
jgi:large subunit ribosomal protein L44e